jgi:DNA repair exonuclease SbcCD nuclease subunit
MSSFSFLHLADTHLGYEQYGLRERAQDLARAFLQAVEVGLRERVDLVLHAGDVFHSRSLEPLTLLQATEILEPLRKAGIPVAAVSGNHDRGWRGEAVNWLTFLHRRGYLTHLEAPILPGGELKLEPEGGSFGAVLEDERFRVVGLPYLSAALPKVLAQVAAWLGSQARKYTVLLCHAGLDGEMPGFSQPLRKEHLEPLRGLVDYVALGHLHKRYEHDGWIFNPGSLEALGVDEAQYEGGAYLVRVEASGCSSWHHTVSFHQVKRRPFLRLELDVGRYLSPEELEQEACTLFSQRSRQVGRQALVEVVLKGRLQFSPSALQLNRLEELATQELEPLKLLVRNLTTHPHGGGAGELHLSRAALEEHLLCELLSADARYTPFAQLLARTAREVKELALADTEPALLFSRLDEEFHSLLQGQSEAR